MADGKERRRDLRYRPVSPTWRVELAWRRWLIDQVQTLAEEAAGPREVWHAGVCIAIYPPIDDLTFTCKMADLKLIWERGEHSRKYRFDSDLQGEELEDYLQQQLTAFGEYARLERGDDLDAQSQITEYELHWYRWLLGDLPHDWCGHAPASEYLEHFMKQRREVDAKLDAVRDADAETIRAALRDVERRQGAKPVSELQ